MYDCIHEGFTDIAIKYLDLKPTDKLADIGGGTGAVAEMISKRTGEDLQSCFFDVDIDHLHSGLQTPVCVVEPVEKLLVQATNRHGVKPVLATCSEFYKNPTYQANQYNKVLFCASIHHLPDQLATLRMIYNCMPTGGVCLMITSGNTTLPLWKKAKTTFDPNPEYIQAFEQVFGAVHKTTESFFFTIKKSAWIAKLRCRIFSNFEEMSDEEIEKGIVELEETEFKGIDNEDELNLEYQVICYKAIR